MVFGAALNVENLDDLAVVDMMARKMECPSLFELSNWADVRISCGERGSFLFINNYQDDPLETTIEYQEKMMFGGNPITLAARTGAILPIDWQLREDVLIHYATAEISEVAEDGSTITIKAAQDEFGAEMTLRGYACEQAVIINSSLGIQCVRIHAKDGRIVLMRIV